jgi:hypothetical protein
MSRRRRAAVALLIALQLAIDVAFAFSYAEHCRAEDQLWRQAARMHTAETMDGSHAGVNAVAP